MQTQRPPLSGSRLDRDARARTSPDALAEAWREPGAALLRLRGVAVPVREPAVDAGPVLELEATSGDYASEAADGGPVCYLGRASGRPVFAVDEGPVDDGGAEPLHEGVRWRHPFEVAALLDETELELLAVASALLRWHEAAGFSPRDGAATRADWGGWARRDAQGVEMFPRTDPAVIVLVEHDDRVLLGSNVLWETGRFSLLAGFVEAGESLEQTVVREIEEEAGVALGEIRYVASQPWPFPRSLMLGFRARLAAGADPGGLRPDPEEISELRWFTRDELREPAPGIKLPMGASIARWMIDQWVAEGDA